jgi:serine O-acetyltransferase
MSCCIHSPLQNEINLMIRSRKDYLDYLEADRLALGRSGWMRTLFVVDPIWVFQRLLRKVEYYTNCKPGLMYKPYLFYLKFKFNQYKLLLGFTIPPNVFGPGLCIAHYGTIIVHNNARLGANIRINADVVIGENNGEDNVPMIGNSVVIEPGAKIFGKITIADGIHIGANSVVNKSFNEPNVVIVGAPARVVGKI